jgi:hypothetical protein
MNIGYNGMWLCSQVCSRGLRVPPPALLRSPTARALAALTTTAALMSPMPLISPMPLMLSMPLEPNETTRGGGGVDGGLGPTQRRTGGGGGRNSEMSRFFGVGCIMPAESFGERVASPSPYMLARTRGNVVPRSYSTCAAICSGGSEGGCGYDNSGKVSNSLGLVHAPLFVLMVTLF